MRLPVDGFIAVELRGGYVSQRDRLRADMGIVHTVGGTNTYNWVLRTTVMSAKMIPPTSPWVTSHKTVTTNGNIHIT